MNIQRNEQGFSLIELLIVVAIIGIIATIAVPQLMNALDRGRQKRTMADMRNIASAEGTFRVDTGAYGTFDQLETGDYMGNVPANDGWGNAWAQEPAAGQTYTLSSAGADGEAGTPAAPDPWTDEDQEYDADLILTDGEFTQAPGLGT